jgi:multidrug efflux pump subunit AcrA (membrane-fusion protein)
MKRVRSLLGLLLLLAIGAGAYYYGNRSPSSLVLTGIVTTNDVVVSPQIAGQIQQLLVREGDAVKKDQLLAVLTPDELRQERAFTHSAEGATSQVRESAAALRFQEQQTADQIRQAEATLSATESQRTAAEADLENARLISERQQKMTSQASPRWSIRSGADGVRRGQGAGRLAGEAGGRATLGRRARACQRRAGLGPAQPAAGERAPGGGGERATGESRCPARLHRNSCADRRHRRRLRSAPRRSGQSQAARRHLDQSR